jgi:hypothetical protein
VLVVFEVVVETWSLLGAVNKRVPRAGWLLIIAGKGTPRGHKEGAPHPWVALFVRFST